MDCWEFLELSPDSDERAIKRRYAQLLKRYRPDDDAEAFQNLREAYDQALQQARWRSCQDAPELPEASDAPAVGGALELSVLLRQEPAAAPHWDFHALRGAQLLPLLASAEAEGQRQAFEEALLRHCLAAFDDSRELRDWALSQLYWYALEQPTELPPPAMAALADGMARERLADLAGLLAEGRERDVTSLLEETLGQPWMQAFDRRDGFLRNLVECLLERPGWSAGFFERICTLCAWSDHQHAGENYQWQALVHEAEASACEARLRGFMQLGMPANAEQRAAWALLKPMPEWRRNKLISPFADEDWQACARLSDILEHRYPQLLERFDNPDLDSWRGRHPDLAGAGWAYLKPTLWLLLLLSLMPYALGNQDLPRAIIFSAVVATMMFVFGSLLLNGWLWLLGGLDGFDRRVSRLVLPEALHREGLGLLVLRHLLPAALLCFQLPLVMGIRLGGTSLVASLLLFVACVYYLNMATRGISLVGVLVRHLRGRLGKILLVCLLLAGLFGYVSQRWQALPERAALEDLLPAQPGQPGPR